MTAARDVAEAADQGDGHPAAAWSQTVIRAAMRGGRLRDAATTDVSGSHPCAMTDGGGCGSRKQEAAAHRYASKWFKGSIAGRGAALLRSEKYMLLFLDS